MSVLWSTLHVITNVSIMTYPPCWYYDLPSMLVLWPPCGWEWLCSSPPHRLWSPWPAWLCPWPPWLWPWPWPPVFWLWAWPPWLWPWPPWLWPWALLNTKMPVRFTSKPMIETVWKKKEIYFFFFSFASWLMLKVKQWFCIIISHLVATTLAALSIKHILKNNHLAKDIIH